MRQTCTPCLSILMKSETHPPPTYINGICCAHRLHVLFDRSTCGCDSHDTHRYTNKRMCNRTSSSSWCDFIWRSAKARRAPCSRCFASASSIIVLDHFSGLALAYEIQARVSTCKPTAARILHIRPLVNNKCARGPRVTCNPGQCVSSLYCRNM